MANQEFDDYRIVIYDRFCDDVRAFNKIIRCNKVINYAGLRFNKNKKIWEMNIIYKDKTSIVISEPEIMIFISECKYVEC